MKHLAVNDAWLARHVEAALEPELPIVDAHHHLWDRPDLRYLPEDFVADHAGHNIVETVYLECTASYRTEGPAEAMPLGETEYLRSVGDAADARPGTPRVAAAIVAYAELMLGDKVAPILEEHVQLGAGRVKAIRNSACWDEDETLRLHLRQPKSPIGPGMMMHPRFREGFAHLKRVGLSYDAWMYHTQLHELQDLAQAFPEVQIVINHVGGPVGMGRFSTMRQQAFDDWSKALRSIARLPNTVLKFGGLGMAVLGIAQGAAQRPTPPSSDELARSWKAYFDVCMEAFGPYRTMFESNFPVDKGAMSYGVMWNAFKKLSRGMSESERTALFSATARQAYRLGC